MDEAILVVWAVAGIWMGAIVLMEVVPGLRHWRRTRRGPLPPG